MKFAVNWKAVLVLHNSKKETFLTNFGIFLLQFKILLCIVQTVCSIFYSVVGSVCLRSCSKQVLKTLF